MKKKRAHPSAVGKVATENLKGEDLGQDDLTPIYPELLNLSDSMIRTLIAVVRNVLSDDSKTETQLAAELRIDRHTLYLHRRKREFGLALTAILGDIIKGTSDRAIKALFKRAEHDTAAIKVWLNMAELWIDRRQQLGLNAGADHRIPKISFTETVDDVLTLIGSAGWSEERLMQRFRELKEEGAF